MTGLSSHSDEKDSLSAGCDIFLSKPVDMHTLEHILRTRLAWD